jgi:hypothetical protein
MNAAGVAEAAEGTRFIVHGANPPMYRNWPKLVLPMLESTIAAAKASGARILFPGSIYNFPPDGPLVLREDTPQRATTRKGVIRIVMERRLEEAQAQGRAQFDFARRRFLRSIYDWQQLVPAACQTGPPGAVDHLSGFAGHRAFLGLSAGCWRNHGAARGAGCKPCRLRGVSLQGPLVRARDRDGRSHTRRRCRSAPAGPSHALVTCRGRVAFCAADARVVGNALSLASANPTRQYQARIDPRERAAYPGRGGGAGIAGRAR